MIYQCINKTGINLQWLRKRIGVTIEELAVALNEGTETVYSWENGESDPGKESFQRIADFFGIDKSALLLLDISETNLFTSRKESSIKKKLLKLRTSTYH
jgi:transcriptional regulator with XRE-family HTH domain